MTLESTPVELGTRKTLLFRYHTYPKFCLFLHTFRIVIHQVLQELSTRLVAHGHMKGNASTLVLLDQTVGVHFEQDVHGVERRMRVGALEVDKT